MMFFAVKGKYCAFNLRWHEKPARSIRAFSPRNFLLTKPGMANHEGDHSSEYPGFPSSGATDPRTPPPRMAGAARYRPLPVRLLWGAFRPEVSMARPSLCGDLPHLAFARPSAARSLPRGGSPLQGWRVLSDGAALRA